MRIRIWEKVEVPTWNNDHSYTIRGAAYDNYAQYYHAAFRVHNNPVFRYDCIGFRLVRRMK